MEVIEILKLIPNYGISVFVIWIGYRLFSEITGQVREVNTTLARLVTMMEIQNSRKGGER